MAGDPRSDSTILAIVCITWLTDYDVSQSLACRATVLDHLAG